MEEESSNCFSQDVIYGENIDDFMRFLSMPLLDEDATNDFRTLIHQHVEAVMTSKKYQLPSFGNEIQWLNTIRPLSFENDFGKKIYVMDFFTYCCINCIHVLPYLKKVESEFADNHAFAVLGIHSPKFPNEKELYQVKDAIIRNDIRHPVINDPEHRLWIKYGISCWPTVFIVGPGHVLLFVLVGEIQIEKLSFLCHHILKYFESSTVELNVSPIPVHPLEKHGPKVPDLMFPGSVSTNGDQILVSDTGHNRLLLMSRFSIVEETIGSGAIGCNDGSFKSATFSSPHGTAWYENVVYVADTGNHSIRKVDFKEKIVSTVFKIDYPISFSDEKSTYVPFRSPWDVCIGPKLDSDFKELNVLYIAVAGSHQIWSLPLDASSSDSCVPFAGSGEEGNKQNLYRFKANFAQPSGIAYSSLIPDRLFVADSESSTIKSIALKGGAVQTIIGGGHDPTDLFQFGDNDGNYIHVKLQHPMSLCIINKNTLAITDTYNHKIKFVDVKDRKCETFNVESSLNEPSGICNIDMLLLVADTNNHRVLQVAMTDKVSVVMPSVYNVVQDMYNLSFKDHPKTDVSLDYDGKIYCHFYLEPSFTYELNKDVCQTWSTSQTGDLMLQLENLEKNLFGISQPSLLMKSVCYKESDKLNTGVSLLVQLPLCHKKLKMCCLKELRFKINVNHVKDGPKAVSLNFRAFVDDL